MILCPKCNKQCTTRSILKRHINAHHKSCYNSELEIEQDVVYTVFGKAHVDEIVNDYANENICVNDININISRYLSLLGIKRTQHEEKMTSRYKDKYMSTIHEKYGTHITNVSQLNFVKQSKKDTIESKYGDYNKYLENNRINMKEGYNTYLNTPKHKDTIDKIKNTCLERYGNSNFGSSETSINKRISTYKETIKNWDIEERRRRTEKARSSVSHRGGYSSKLEKRVQKSLVSLDVSFVNNKMLFGYNWDIILCDYYIIIEVQGTLWHADKRMYKSNDLILGKILAQDIWDKDARKKEKACKEGYIVIELWEDEINKCNDVKLEALIEDKLQEAINEITN